MSITLLPFFVLACHLPPILSLQMFTWNIPMKPPALLIVTRIMSSRLSHIALAVRRAIQELQALEDVRIPASPCCALCNHCAQHKSVTSCAPERAPPFPAHEPSFPIASHGRNVPDPATCPLVSRGPRPVGRRLQEGDAAPLDVSEPEPAPAAAPLQEEEDEEEDQAALIQQLLAKRDELLRMQEMISNIQAMGEAQAARAQVADLDEEEEEEEEEEEGSDDDEAAATLRMLMQKQQELARMRAAISELSEESPRVEEIAELSLIHI